MESAAAELDLFARKASTPQSLAPSQARRRVVQYIAVAALFGDTVSVLLGLVMGFWIRFASGWITFGVETHTHDLSSYYGLFGVGLLFFYFTFLYLGFYEEKTLLNFRLTCSTMAKGTVFWVLAYLGGNLALKFDPPISRIYACCSFFCTFGYLLVWRAILVRVLQSPTVVNHLRQRMMIVGWTEDISRLLTALDKDPAHLYDVIGYVSTAPNVWQGEVAPIVALGGFDSIEVLLKEHHPDTVVLANSGLHSLEIVKLVNLCEQYYIDFKKIPSYFHILLSGLDLELISGIPMMGIVSLPLDRLGYRMCKRIIDVIGSIVGLILSAPLMLFCGACVHAESSGRVFFVQERVGYGGKRFRMYKMRTMKLGSERLDHLNQSTLPDDQRVLDVGRWMRRWNIDETPQFFNVLKGDMSLVGPRPERGVHSCRLSEEIPHYNARYNCKPGMTGWAQVNGFRGGTSLVERVRYDLFYLEHWNLWLDFQIMIQTFFRRENAY